MFPSRFLVKGAPSDRREDFIVWIHDVNRPAAAAIRITRRNSSAEFRAAAATATRPSPAPMSMQSGRIVRRTRRSVKEPSGGRRVKIGPIGPAGCRS
jgi:hypothetical protein